MSDSTTEEWDKKYNKYIQDGMSENEAKGKANKKLKEVDLKLLMNKYVQVIKYILQLKNGKLHKKVMAKVQLYIDDGYDWMRAIKMVVGKYKHELQSLIEETEDGNESDTEDESDSEDEGDEADDEVDGE